jgi:hypothetical protein
LFEGAANARLAVFVGATSFDFLFYRFSGSILRVRILGKTLDWMKSTKDARYGLFKRNARFFAVRQITQQCLV